MSAVLVAGLTVPLVGAVASVVLRSHRWSTPVTAATTAAVWAVLAAAGDPPTLGRIEPEPVVAAAVAGAALLVASRPPTTALARSALTSGLAVLAVGAATGDRTLPDRPLAGGLVGVALLSAIALRSDRSAPLTAALVPAAGALAGVGLLLDEPGRAGVLVGIGGIAVLVAVATLPVPAPLLAPAAVLATARVAADADGSTALATAAAGAGLVGAALLVWRRVRGNGAAAAPAAAVVAAAVVLVAQDVPGLAPAAVLLAAGGVLALASGHPLALVAALPGLAAALEAFGAAGDPEHALAGAAAAGLLAAGAAGADATADGPGRDRWPITAVAVAFGAVPLWGWSGAVPEDHLPAVAVAAAVAAVVVVGGLAARAAPTAGPLVAGRIERRPKAATHASTHSLVEGGGPIEGAAEGPEGVGPRPGRPPQRPLAVPPRPVPGRPRTGGVGRRGRLRARPGRPA